MFFIKIYIKESYMNCYHTSIQMCGQYCILAPKSSSAMLKAIMFRSMLVIFLQSGSVTVMIHAIVTKVTNNDIQSTLCIITQFNAHNK